MDAWEQLTTGISEAIVSFAGISVNAAGALVDNSTDWLREVGMITLVFLNDLGGIIIAFLRV